MPRPEAGVPPDRPGISNAASCRECIAAMPPPTSARAPGKRLPSIRYHGNRPAQSRQKIAEISESTSSDIVGRGRPAKTQAWRYCVAQIPNHGPMSPKQLCQMARMCPAILERDGERLIAVNDASRARSPPPKPTAEAHAGGCGDAVIDGYHRKDHVVIKRLKAGSSTVAEKAQRGCNWEERRARMVAREGRDCSWHGD